MGIPAISFLNPQVKEREARPVNNFFQTGQIPPISVSTGNEYGISIPKNSAYTFDVDGTKVATGQDGYGWAHRSPNEYKLHLIA